MKRRSLLLLPWFALAGRAFGQDSPRRTKSSTPKARRVSDDEDEGPSPPDRRSKAAEPARVDNPADVGAEAGQGEGVPANFPNQAGFEWKTFPIAAYTALSPNAASPQTAIIDWILRRTTPAPWHGDKVAVLCASRTSIRAYNSPKVLKDVAEVVDRFVDSTADVLTVRVRFLSAPDSRWRYTTNRLLTPVGGGPQGQQIWHTTTANAEMVVAQMSIWPGFKNVGETQVDVLNGQTLKFPQLEKKPFTASVQREGAVGVGYQPKVENLEEGIVLRISPLLSYEGDSLDAAIELSTNLVRKLHQVKVLSAREVGTGELTIDVPEVSETRLNQPIKNWPLGQALVISTGVQPGLLLDKGGFLNMKIPGTTPSATETVIVINVEVSNKKGQARNRPT